MRDKPKLWLTCEEFEKIESKAWSMTVDKGKTHHDFAVKLWHLIEKKAEENRNEYDKYYGRS